MVLHFDPKHCLPSSYELPDSDDTPVDNVDRLGIRYYAVYQPNRRSRRQRQPLEVYRLADGLYEQLTGEWFWLPEVGLGLGRERGRYMGYEREWLYWYDEAGNRLPTPEDAIQQQQTIAQQKRNRAQQERNRAERLTARLRALGVEPDEEE